MRSNKSVANPIPQQNQLFPEEIGTTRQTGHLFYPQSGSVEYFYHQTEIKYPQLRKGHQYKYLQPEYRDLFSHGKKFQTHNSFMHHFTAYTCMQCSHLFSRA